MTMNTPPHPMVDNACFDLAMQFLGELPGAVDDDVWQLAEAIQTACEDACKDVENRQKQNEARHG